MTIVAVADKTLARRQLLRAFVIVSACSLVYALYRGFDGLGGTIGMIGTPTSESSRPTTNAGSAIVLLLVVLLPFAAPPLWSAPDSRRVLLIVAWGLPAGGVWLTGALAAVAVITCIGLLSAFGVAGRAIVG